MLYYNELVIIGSIYFFNNFDTMWTVYKRKSSLVIIIIFIFIYYKTILRANTTTKMMEIIVIHIGVEVGLKS